MCTFSCTIALFHVQAHSFVHKRTFSHMNSIVLENAHFSCTKFNALLLHVHVFRSQQDYCKTPQVQHNQSRFRCVSQSACTVRTSMSSRKSLSILIRPSLSELAPILHVNAKKKIHCKQRRACSRLCVIRTSWVIIMCYM